LLGKKKKKEQLAHSERHVEADPIPNDEELGRGKRKAIPNRKYMLLE
jgi:hypothetical protein